MFRILTKSFCLVLLCCFMLFLTSCIAGDTSLIYWSDKTASTVELINYDNSDAKTNPSEECTFELAKLEVIETLNSEQIENFSSDIDIFFHVIITRKQFLYSHDGIGLRFIYEDGCFQIITLTKINDNHYFFVAIYEEDETMKESYDVENAYATKRFEEVINEYFTTQISFDEEYID